MKSFIQIIILIHCAIVLPLFPKLSFAQTLEYEVEVSYPEKNPRLDITIVVGKEHKDNIDYFKNLTLESLRIVEDIFKIEFKDDFSVVFDPRQDFHNGMATVVPTNRISIYTEVPTLESSIGLVREAHLETTVHEMAHMMMLQQRRGVFIPLSWIVGNLSRPNALFPRWVHEGTAVWAESHLGGRGQGGVIDAEKRKYAEYFQRNNKHPLTSDLMDGSLELNAMEPGNMPYHFGYLMIEELMKDKESKSMGELVKKSAVLPGWFFHRLYSKNGKKVGKVFDKIRDEWSKASLPKAPERKQVQESANITGPFVSGKGLSWIFSSDRRQNIANPKTKLSYYDGEKLIETPFFRGSSRILQSFWSDALDAWVLLAYSIDIDGLTFLNKRIYLVDKKGSLLCENNEIKRIREIAVDGTNLALIRSDRHGQFTFEKASIDRKCKIPKERKTLYASGVAYERLSHPWIKGEEWLLSKGRGRDLSRDYIIGSSNFSFETKDGAMAYPQFVQQGSEKKLLFTWYKKDYRGPALVDLKTKNVKTYSVRTEAPSNYALPEKEQIVSKTSLWEKDQIQSFDFAESEVKEESKSETASLAQNGLANTQVEDKAPPQIPLPEGLDKKTEGTNANAEVESYWPVPSIFPHFWYPNVESTDKGTTISGSTFFMDLADNWSGALLAGWDTGARRPMGYFTLVRDNIRMGMLNQWELEGLSNFRYIGTQIQDIQIAKTQFRISQRLSSRFTFAVYPGAEFRHGSKVGNLRQYSVGAGALSFLFASPHAQNIRLGNYQITHFNDAFYFNSNIRWLPEPSFEIYSNFQGKMGPIGYLIGVEYGRTAPASFPIVYYEWGGRSDFSTLDTGFLARGFQTSIGPSLQILRPHFEFGFRVWDFQRGIPWNRLHLRDIEIRPLYEVITTDVYNATSTGARKTKVRMGSEYFHTAGVELDVFFQALHYADFKASFGYFHGFGRIGEDNFGLKLQALSDFF